MSGRRSHSRFAVANPWEGTLTVLRDVVVNRRSADEILAVSHAPGIIGELMRLHLIGAGATLGLDVMVLESRPVMFSGAVRHRIRLGVVAPPESAQVFAPPAVLTGIAAEAL
jgi:hypothetical protein